MTYRLHVSGSPPPIQVVGPDWGVGVEPWPTLTPEPGRPLWESYGICSHPNFDGVYLDPDAWTQKVADLEAYVFRGMFASNLARVRRTLVRAKELGLKWNATVASLDADFTEHQLRTRLEAIAADPEPFISIEGVNEPDRDGLTADDVTRTVRYQQIIWDFVNSHPELAHIAVLSPALRRPAGLTLYQRFVDAGLLGTFHVVSLHHYGRAGMIDVAELGAHIGMVQGAWLCDRFWISETGSTNATESTDPRRCTEAESAAYSIRNLFDLLSDPRVEKVFRYELLDDPGPLTDNEARFGVFRADGTPKPEVAHIRGFTNTTRDDAAPFDPPAVELEVDAPVGVRWRLVQRSGAPPVLWLWRPGVLHDVAPLDVTVRRPTGDQTVSVGGRATTAPLLAL